MINAYYLAYFNVATLKGNMFVNAIILGSAETFANLSSGFLMLKVKEEQALRICCIISLIFNGLLLLVSSEIISYVCLFFAIGGLGGMFNSMFLVIEM